VTAPLYRADLALVHDRGFAHHAERCAPGVLALLAPVLARDGLVLEVGCGSGLLTRHLVDAGHRVLATDASPAMLDLARDAVPAAEFRVLTLPDDPLPEADAVVGVGHPLNYVDDPDAVRRGLVAMARALRPGGVLVLDLCDLSWAGARRDAPPFARVDDDWAIVTRFAVPAPDRFVRDITTFVRQPDGSWRRDDERHENALVDVSGVPALLAAEGVDARTSTVLGDAELPPGLMAVTGRRGEWRDRDGD
jgi:SAM-dependent methyltransferase